MIDRDRAIAIAHEWLEAWNAHDADRVVEHFSDDVVVHSPLAAQRQPDSNGTLRGKAAVLAYYRDGLSVFPDLRFSIVEVCVGVNEVSIVYRNHRDTAVVEMLVFGDDGRAHEVYVSYGA